MRRGGQFPKNDAQRHLPELMVNKKSLNFYARLSKIYVISLSPQNPLDFKCRSDLKIRVWTGVFQSLHTRALAEDKYLSTLFICQKTLLPFRMADLDTKFDHKASQPRGFRHIVCGRSRGQRTSWGKAAPFSSWGNTKYLVRVNTIRNAIGDFREIIISRKTWAINLMTKLLLYLAFYKQFRIMRVYRQKEKKCK